jgi:hypothetical protein
VHYRDNTTNEVPNYIAYPNASINWSGTPAIPSSSGNVNSAGGVPAAPDTAHQPSLAYMPWLLTARWFFLDELLLWDFWNYLQTNYVTRAGSTGTGASNIYFDNQIRARGWNLRTLAQALNSVPASHPSYTSLYNAWSANMAAYCARYVDGTSDGGTWKNGLGCMGLYSGNSNGSSPYGTDGTYWWDSPWMQAIVAMSIGYAWDLGLPGTAQTQSNHLAVRDFGYSAAIGRAGPPSTSGAWDYRNFSCYIAPFSTPASTAPGSWLSSWGAAYPVYEEFAGANFTALPAVPSGTTMYYGTNPLGTDDWALSSATAFPLAVLTYAVNHGTTGAAQAWLRITSSTSWSYAVPAYQANPLWGIYPLNPPS